MYSKVIQLDIYMYLQASLVAQTVKSLPVRWETQVQPLGRDNPLEKEMATHSSILAWEILWTEEPTRLHGGLKESDTTTSPYSFSKIFPFRLLQSIKQSSLCYIVSPYWLSILNIEVCTCQP